MEKSDYKMKRTEQDCAHQRFAKNGNGEWICQCGLLAEEIPDSEINDEELTRYKKFGVG